VEPDYKWINQQGCGNSSLYNINYVCTCGTKANINMPNDGFSVEYKENEE
jgi:hypothetical protein